MYGECVMNWKQQCVVAIVCVLGMCRGCAMEYSSFRPFRSPLDSLRSEQGIQPELVEVVVHAEDDLPVLIDPPRQEFPRALRSRRQRLAVQQRRGQNGLCYVSIICCCGVFVGMGIMAALCGEALGSCGDGSGS